MERANDDVTATPSCAHPHRPRAEGGSRPQAAEGGAEAVGRSSLDATEHEGSLRRAGRASPSTPCRRQAEAKRGDMTPTPTPTPDSDAESDSDLRPPTTDADADDRLRRRTPTPNAELQREVGRELDAATLCRREEGGRSFVLSFSPLRAVGPRKQKNKRSSPLCVEGARGARHARGASQAQTPRRMPSVGCPVAAAIAST
jgi:hypothetical protein